LAEPISHFAGLSDETEDRQHLEIQIRFREPGAGSLIAPVGC
jgi:hypothetical protein